MLKRILLIAVVGINYCVQAQPLDRNDRIFRAMQFPDQPFVVRKAKPLLIAIVDGAFDTSAKNLPIPLFVNQQEIPNGIDDDGNGLIDDISGWDFADNDADVTGSSKQQGQALHANAVASVMWEALQKLINEPVKNVRLLPIKTKSDFSQNNYLPEGYKGIEYALAKHADIIVCAWSGAQFSAANQALLDRVNAAGAIIVGSAGNYLAMTAAYPGAYAPVINVAAASLNFAKMPVSNYGTFVDATAIGDSVYYRQNDNGYYFNGTSAATAVVAAVVAAMKIVVPDADATVADILLKNTSLPIDANNKLYAGNLGAGLIQATDALEFVSIGKLPERPGSQSVKGYIQIGAPDQGAIISPQGKFPSIWFKDITGNISKKSRSLSSIDIQLFRDQYSTDTLIKANSHPLVFSVTTESFSVRTSTKKTGQSGWIYYEAQTIDSSLLYCNGIKYLSGQKGELEDGSGPLNYAGRSDCKWQLVAPPGKKIKVQVGFLDTEPQKDFLYIFNGTGTDAPILAMLSGAGPIPAITSWGNEMLLWFVTNETNQQQGWKLNWEVVDQ